MPVSTVGELVSVDELRLLFAGDELTAGYPTIRLALTLCERTLPGSVTELKRSIYGELPMDEIPHGEREAMARAYAAWVAAGCPNAPQ